MAETQPSPQPSMPVIEFNWKLAGKAGEGVMTTAATFARGCHRHGMNVFNYYEYPSLIKGGHQTGQVFASFADAHCQKRTLDLLVALDEDGIRLHTDEITPDTIIIAESTTDKYDKTKYANLTAHILEIPMTNIAREQTGNSLAANMVALGSSAYLLGLNVEIFHKLIREQFASKGTDVQEKNVLAFQAGYAAAQPLSQPKYQVTIQPQPNLLLNGGEAIGTGALAAGLQFYSAYPMSPSSNTFHFIAAQQDKYPLVVRHAEDEISAINLAIGASYAGVRAMTGSAGGGFALMVESMSLLGVTEVPLVVLVAQRPGPATGLPTWTGQGDLQFVLRAGHGEFQRVIMTPGTTQEHFELTRQAFELAEKYQLPVIILTDKFLIEAEQTMPMVASEYPLQRHSLATDQDRPADNSYRRYKITDSGISPRSIPGQPNGLQITNSYEHDEFGFATEDAAMTIAQVDKRARKLTNLIKEIPQPIVYGPVNAELSFVSWGSTISVLQQTLAELTRMNFGHTVNVLHFPCVWPFPSDAFQKFAHTAKQMVIIEGNHTGQFEQLIKQETGYSFTERIRRYDGRPFYSEDIIEYIKLKLKS